MPDQGSIVELWKKRSKICILLGILNELIGLNRLPDIWNTLIDPQITINRGFKFLIIAGFAFNPIVFIILI